MSIQNDIVNSSIFKRMILGIDGKPANKKIGGWFALIVASIISIIAVVMSFINLSYVDSKLVIDTNKQVVNTDVNTALILGLVGIFTGVTTLCWGMQSSETKKYMQLNTPPSNTVTSTTTTESTITQPTDQPK